MAQKTIAYYRLPVPTSTQVGHLRIVIDRNYQAYVAGSKVLSATISGQFLVLKLASKQSIYVKRKDYEAFKARPLAQANQVAPEVEPE